MQHIVDIESLSDTVVGGIMVGSSPAAIKRNIIVQGGGGGGGSGSPYTPQMFLNWSPECSPTLSQLQPHDVLSTVVSTEV